MATYLYLNCPVECSAIEAASLHYFEICVYATMLIYIVFNKGNNNE